MLVCVQGLERLQKSTAISAVAVPARSKSRRMQAWMNSLLSELDMLLHDL